MEGHCSTGQSPQWAVVPIVERKKERKCTKNRYCAAERFARADPLCRVREVNTKCKHDLPVCVLVSACLVM